MLAHLKITLYVVAMQLLVAKPNQVRVKEFNKVYRPIAFGPLCKIMNFLTSAGKKVVIIKLWRMFTRRVQGKCGEGLVKQLSARERTLCGGCNNMGTT